MESQNNDCFKQIVSPKTHSIAWVSIATSDWMGVLNIEWRHSVYAFSVKSNQMVYYKLPLYIKLELKYWEFHTLQL